MPAAVPAPSAAAVGRYLLVSGRGVTFSRRRAAGVEIESRFSPGAWLKPGTATRLGAERPQPLRAGGLHRARRGRELPGPQATPPPRRVGDRPSRSGGCLPGVGGRCVHSHVHHRPDGGGPKRSGVEWRAVEPRAMGSSHAALSQRACSRPSINRSGRDAALTRWRRESRQAPCGAEHSHTAHGCRACPQGGVQSHTGMGGGDWPSRTARLRRQPPLLNPSRPCGARPARPAVPRCICRRAAACRPRREPR
jgi:hypothetical protein